MIISILALLIRLATGIRADPAFEWPEKPSILFANHMSHLDFLVIWAGLPNQIRKRTSPVAARDYWEKTKLRKWISKKAFQAILLDRSGRPQDRSHPLAPVNQALEAGRSVIIFPEGTRSMTGEMGELKSGLDHLRRLHPTCPLIPISLDNLNRILPKGQCLAVPLIGRMIVHPPLKSIPQETRKEFLERAQQVVASELKKKS